MTQNETKRIEDLEQDIVGLKEKCRYLNICIERMLSIVEALSAIEKN